jgi:hypothetical protein|tara:strand:+ start:208 stop:918 length:711 start_codon:yes stop_codon:yes gene_type:complete
MNRFRLMTIRERCGFILLGWGVLSGVLVALIILFTVTIYPFLAPTQSVQGKVLVADQVLPDHALEKVQDRFRNGNYQLLVTSGGELSALPAVICTLIKTCRNGHISKYKTRAQLAAATLVLQGVPEEKILIASAPSVQKNRTYAAALEVKKQLTEKGLIPRSIDVVSLGPHSRRTWRIYQMIFSPETQVGIYSIEPHNYNPERWWSSSAGVRTIIGETIAYLYARLIFNAPASIGN